MVHAIPRWRAWVVGSAFSVTLVTVALLLPGARFPVPTRGVGLALSGAALGVAALLVRSRLGVWAIGHTAASLLAAVSIGVLALTATIGPLVSPGGAIWWSTVVLDLVAVLVACAALLVATRDGRSVTDLIEPVLVHDPLRALELGATPELRAFVAALDRKDRTTREHVERVAALCVRVGEGAGLDARRLRALGLAGLLHDIGKLVVPTAVLTKPGALTEAEFAELRTHAEQGAAILERSAVLRDVAPLVRAHHERADGRGYPDGISVCDLPVEVGMLAVCDAWDAMTQDRHYRRGLGTARATEILREGAGSQWSAAAVSTLLDVVAVTSGDSRGMSVAHDRAGTGSSVDVYVLPCLDALPPEVAEAVEREVAVGA